MKRITDPAFRYTTSVDTDIRKTFRAERRRLKKLAEERAKRDAQNEAEAKIKVKLLPRNGA